MLVVEEERDGVLGGAPARDAERDDAPALPGVDGEREMVGALEGVEAIEAHGELNSTEIEEAVGRAPFADGAAGACGAVFGIHLALVQPQGVAEALCIADFGEDEAYRLFGGEARRERGRAAGAAHWDVLSDAEAEALETWARERLLGVVLERSGGVAEESEATLGGGEAGRVGEGVGEEGVDEGWREFLGGPG